MGYKATFHPLNQLSGMRSNPRKWNNIMNATKEVKENEKKKKDKQHEREQRFIELSVGSPDS